MEYVSKKVEKLVTAVYMLTDFISDTEPMKVRMRDLSLSILSDTHSIDGLLLPEKKNALRKLLERIESMISHFEVAASLKLVSPMNTQILKDEFSSVEEILRDYVFGPNTTTPFSPTFFTLPEPERMKKTGDSQGQIIKDNTRRSGGYQGQKLSQQQDQYDIKDKEINETKSVTIKNATQSNIKKSEERFLRRTQILVAIKDNTKDNQGATIKDIFRRLRGVGEKTLQRELVALIAAGLIKKTGERRWSRYSLR